MTARTQPSDASPTELDRVETPPEGGLRIRRRDLLAGAGAVALLPAFEGIARAQGAAAATSGAKAMALSVGFVNGSDTWPSFKGITVANLNRGDGSKPGAQVTPIGVTPAASLISGDQQLANEVVRVGVHGLYPIPNPTTIKSAYLTVFFPSDNPGLAPGPLPFTAWGYHSKPAPDPGASVKFLSGLAADGGLDMLLEVAPAGKELVTRRVTIGKSPGAVGGNFVANFTVDWFAGRPKLQRGLYLLGLAPYTWDEKRLLPIFQPGQPRPLELLSLMLSFEPLAKR